jgi:hypothetical protein
VKSITGKQSPMLRLVQQNMYLCRWQLTVYALKYLTNLGMATLTKKKKTGNGASGLKFIVM